VPLFNPANEAERQREAIIQERNRMILERKFILPLNREFNRVAREASKSNADMVSVINQHRKNIADILGKLYADTIDKTAKRTISEGQKAFDMVLETKDIEGEIGRLITQWIFVNALIESNLISGTTADLIASAIAVNVGEGERVISKAIREAVGGNIAQHRARTIARTETHDASQASQLEMVNKMNFPPDGKEWVTIQDGRERDSHRRSDGQERKREDPFDVGGKKMQRPGDRRGGASEVINCRCVMVFIDNDF